MSGALGQSETDLQGLISNFDVTLGAFATQSAALNTAVGLLPGALTTTDRAFAALDASFPVTRAFALDLIPAVKADTGHHRRRAAVDQAGSRRS